MSCGVCDGGLGERDFSAMRYHGLWHKGGVVRWLGINWYGVPFPLRVLMVVRMRANLRRRGIAARSARAMLGLYAGCGCIVILKDAWTKLTG